MAERHTFISDSRHLTARTDSVFNNGELWRVVGVPSSVPTGKRWRVTLEEVPSDTPFEGVLAEGGER